MIDNSQDTHAEKKRVLRKVRTNFLRRKPEEEEDSIVPLLKNVNPSNLHMIDCTAGLVEKNRKILLGVRYLNAYSKIDNVTIEDHYNTKTVILNVGKPDGSKLISWEYSTKRLESYGDLELALWAHKIRNFYENYPILMSRYYRMIQSQDAETQRDLELTRAKINRLKREIETKYPYKRVTFLYGKEKKELVSVSLNEAMLKEIDQTIESFTDWTKENGIPALFDGDSKFAYRLGKSYLDFPSSKIEGIEEGNEVVNYLYDINGCKRKVITQYVRVREPLPAGILISVYILVKSNKACDEMLENSCKSGRASEECSASEFKCVKEEHGEEMGVSIEGCAEEGGSLEKGF